MVEVLTLEEILAIHDELIEVFPDMIPGVDKPEVLKAAVALQDSGRFKEGGDLAERAALLGAGILLRQVFVDGNHRTAWVVMRTFLLRNGAALRVSDAEALDFLHQVLRLAGLDAPTRGSIRMVAASRAKPISIRGMD